MRPVNLIPGEQRGRGGRRRPGGASIAVYGLLGVLAIAVLGVLTLVLTSNRINDRKTTVAALERDEASARAAAETLRPYGNFAQLQHARVETVNSLADSAFNWERVFRQLSRTIPSDTWLTSLTATVDSAVKLEGSSAGGGSAAGLRSKTPHPAIELSGCTYSHRAVARMMTRMRNLDDVTEVTLGGSERPEGKPEEGGGASSAASTGDGGSECRTKYTITKFEILVVLGKAERGRPVTVATGPGATPIANAQGAVATAGNRSAASAGAAP